MTEPSPELALPRGWQGVAAPRRPRRPGREFVAQSPTDGLGRPPGLRPFRQADCRHTRESGTAPRVGGDQRLIRSLAPTRFDVYTPFGTSSPLPTVVWTHGGAFVGGSKDEIGDYLRMIAASGLTVVGVEYAVAPGARYPTPVRQVMAALSHLHENADRLHIDPDQIMLAGDSAGAHITAQVADIVTNPTYGEEVGVEATIEARQLAPLPCAAGSTTLPLSSIPLPRSRM